MKTRRLSPWINCIAFCLCVGLVFPFSATAGETVLFEGESPYTNIRVYEKDDGLRYLSFGVFEQSAFKTDDPSYLHYAYLRTAMASFALAERPVKKVLLVGMGGGSLATFIHRHFPEVEIDVVEIDPVVVRLAKEYFGFAESPEVRVHVGDGRTYLRRSKESYDLIILDAYKAGGIPFHLTTVEFMQLVRDRLNPGGVVAAHLWEQFVNKYFDAQIATIDRVFSNTYRFATGEGSSLIFATPSAEWVDRTQAVEAGEELTRQHRLPFDLGQLIAAQYDPVAAGSADSRILTDDFAPVNLLREQGKD